MNTRRSSGWSAREDGPTLPAQSSTTSLTGCPECDLLFQLRPLAAGEHADCPRCGYAIAAGVPDGFRRPLSYAVASLTFLVLSLSFPFLTVSASGISNTTSLLQVFSLLSQYGADAVAVLVFVFVIAFPTAAMLGMTALTGLLLAQRYHRGLVPLTRLLTRLDHWAMVEVFAIGVIVSLVKIAHMAKLVLGISFWAYLGFALCFVVSMATLDRIAVWSVLERAEAS